jgi:hypothetical protein
VVATFVRVVVGALLAAHGLVHLLYLVTDPDDPTFAFSLRSSWLLPAPVRRPTGLVLIALTVAAFLLLALAVWGVPGLAAIWPGLAITAAALSLVLLFAFWNVRLLAGVAIDVAVIVVAVARPEWTDRIG